MLYVLREFQAPEKSFTLSLCDFALQPLNTIVGKRKVVSCDKTWSKVARTTNVALVVLAYIAATLFAPILSVAFIVKAHMQEHRQLSKWYYYEKIEALLQDRGIVIKSVNRRQEETFGFNIERKNSAQPANPSTLWLEFTWFGKMKYKKLFEQTL